MSVPPVFALSHHSDYRCRHSGACCNAGWTIPVEPERQALIGKSELFQPAGVGCEFYDRGSHLCEIHRQHGEIAIPASCQHFPRRALIDDRGIFVTLSHFCPTAAALLFEATTPLAIVANPPAFPEERQWDGLDARGQWPPLLSPGVLFDLDAYALFEAFLVATLAREVVLDDALGLAASAIERLREWNQRRGSFASWARDAFETADERIQVLTPGTPPRRGALRMPERQRTRVYADVAAHVPEHHGRPTLHADTEAAWRDVVAPRWTDYAEPVKRYIAAKGFGSWTAYQGRGARTLLAEMAVSLRVLEAEVASLCAQREGVLDDAVVRDAIRATDWLLVHLVERQPFVDWLGEVEHVAR